jgi:hypothetical protein
MLISAGYLLALSALCWFLTPTQRIFAFFPVSIFSILLSLYILGPIMREKLFSRLKRVVIRPGMQDNKLIDKRETV